MYEPGKKTGRGLPVYLMVALMALLTVGTLYGVKLYISGDVGETTEAVLKRSSRTVFGQNDYSTERRPYRAISSLPASGGVAILGRSERSRRGAYSGGGSAGGGGRAASGAYVPAGTSRSEKEFIRRHAREIRNYQAYLKRLGMKARAKYPAVRAMDSDFARMDRYMALKRQYDKDRDAYKWARGMMALPEVRRAIVHYSRDPEVVRAMIEVSLEALKNPPSRAVYNEVLGFMCAPEQAGYISSLSGEVMGGATVSIMASVQNGVDMSPLMNLGEQINRNSRNAAGSR